MESRPYFIFGDVLANVSIGALSGFVAAALVGESWNMFVAMVVAMVVGMALALVIGFALFVWICVVHFRTLRRLRATTRALATTGRGRALDRYVQLYALSLEAAMVAFLAAGAFLSVLLYGYFWFLSGLSVALDRAVRAEIRSLRAAEGRSALLPAGS